MPVSNTNIAPPSAMDQILLLSTRTDLVLVKPFFIIHNIFRNATLYCMIQSKLESLKTWEIKLNLSKCTVTKKLNPSLLEL